MQLINTKSHFQAGVGMVEVLVAMLLLAVAVLGFSALQLRAVAASQEAFVRTQAINVARDLTERIRANPTVLASYKTDLNSNAGPAATAPTPNCVTAACTAAQLEARDIYEIRTLAKNFGARLAMYNNTVSTNRPSVIYVAWGNTTPTNSATATANDCTTAGSYNGQPSCIIMEAY